LLVDIPNKGATLPEDIPSMTWHKDALINNTCARLDEFAGNLVNIAHQADEIKANLRMLHPGNISLVEVVRATINKKYAEDKGCMGVRKVNVYKQIYMKKITVE
jgi:hypothetical protein